MKPGTKDLILDPAHLADVPPYKLLESAAVGYIGIDHRFLHAIFDRPESSIPDLVRFAAEDHEDDPICLDGDLVGFFRHLRAPEGIPFLVAQARLQALNIPDDLIETFVQFGAASVSPLLALLEEIEEEEQDAGDVPFLLSQLRVRDPRILEALTRRLEDGDLDAPLSLEMYGDPAAIPSLEAAMARLDPSDIDVTRIKSFIQELSSRPAVEEQEEPFDIWAQYPKIDSPPLELMDEAGRLAMLESGSAELRAYVAEFYRGPAFNQKIAARLLQMAKNDPDAHVRGECWESLGELSNEPEMRRAMLGVLANPEASIEEKGGAVNALAHQTDNPAVFQAIENLYADPQSRAKALQAMGHSFDRRFAGYPPRHLDDPDPEIKRQAIWGVGYLNLASEAPRLEAFFDDEEFRADALFAYSLAVPGETSSGRIRSLLNKIDEAVGGFRPEEEEMAQMALDQRLMIHGKKPVFTADESDESEDQSENGPAVRQKVGRNDPCPCGSGKKYKKCCGA